MVKVDNLDFSGYLKLGIEIAKLNENAAANASKDKNATKIAVLIYLIGGVLSALFMGNIIGIAIVPFLVAGFSFIYVGIIHLLAKIFGGKASYIELYRASGIGKIVSWGIALPFIGIAFSIWSIVVDVVVLRKVHSLATGKAVIVILIPIFIAMALAFILAAALLAGIVASSKIYSSGLPNI